MINDNQFCRSRRLFLPVGECLSLPSAGPPGPPVISLRPEVTGNKSKKGREVSIPDGRAGCLILKRRLRGGVIPVRKLDLPQRRCDPSTIAVS